MYCGSGTTWDGGEDWPDVDGGDAGEDPDTEDDGEEGGFGTDVWRKLMMTFPFTVIEAMLLLPDIVFGRETVDN